MVAGLVACGLPPAEGDHFVSQINRSCPVERDCDPEDPPEDPAPISYALTLKLWNATSVWRKCQLTYSYTSNGVFYSGAIIAGEPVEPDAWRTGLLQVPVGVAVSMTGGCWHPDSGSLERATNSITKTMNRNMAVEFYYSFLNGQPRVEIIQN